MPEPDEATLQAEQIYGWLARPVFPDHPPDLSFLFRLAGLTPGTPESREVYERLVARVALEREHRRLRDGESSNGAANPPHGQIER